MHKAQISSTLDFNFDRDYGKLRKLQSEKCYTVATRDGNGEYVSENDNLNSHRLEANKKGVCSPYSEKKSVRP